MYINIIQLIHLIHLICVQFTKEFKLLKTFSVVSLCVVPGFFYFIKLVIKFP